MHCSATADPTTGRSSDFGLSGTGKTTLSADPKRRLIGDHEHVWSDVGIFNIEGGCYPKTIDLTKECGPEIFNALHFGAFLKMWSSTTRATKLTSPIPTQLRTPRRVPDQFIRNPKIPCIAGHPADIIFLTCDAFVCCPGVQSSPEQAMYHFIAGYTAKVAGTEVGITEPKLWSTCFGAPFMVWHPAKYAELLATKMKQHNVNVWLVNTGWSGGGTGRVLV